MEVLDRSAVPAPSLGVEIVPMASIGVAVKVRGRMLTETMALYEAHQAARKPHDGETPAQADVRAGAEIVAMTLAAQVVASDDKPMWTAQQWLIHGGNHAMEVLAVHAVAQRLAGVSEDTLKN